jgi:hypothetical protein
METTKKKIGEHYFVLKDSKTVQYQPSELERLVNAVKSRKI